MSKRSFKLGFIANLIVLVAAFSSAWGATYYIAPAPQGNDANAGTATAPWATFNKAFAIMSGGDTLIVKDGVYTYPNVISEPPGPPSGSAGNYTVVKAEHDGGVVIDAKFADNAIRILNKSYIQIEGFKALNGEGAAVSAVVSIDTSNHIKVLRVGAANSKGSYDVVFSIGRSSYCLIEDSWAWGINEALLTIYESDHNIVRRFVGRTDTIETPMIGERGIRFYSSPNNLMQNVIAIDFKPNILADAYANFAMSNVKNLSYNNEWIGNIILNVGQYTGFMIAEQGAGGNSFKNSVIWGANAGGIVTKGGTSSSTIDQVTVGSIKGAGFDSNNSGDVIKNSVFINNTGSNGGAPASYNIYFNSGSPQGSYYSTNDPALRYLERTSDTGTGENGAKRGATIEKRYGVSGTLWGEPGYNNLTNEDLWPWPNEARIRNDFREVLSYPSSAISILVDTKRGFCADGTTLTQYIWSYLGYPNPYAGTAKVPAAPKNAQVK